MNTQVLVTGGAGRLGNQVCELLAKNGFDPIAIDKFMHSTYESLPAFGITVEADLNDETRLSELFQEHRFAAIIHCARINKTEESIEMPDFYYENNFGGTLSILKAMQNSGVSVLLYPHSSAPQETPLQRSYAMTEQLLKDAAKAYSMHIEILQTREATTLVSRLQQILDLSI